MNRKVKLAVGDLIRRTVGTLSFIRIIEWRQLLKWLTSSAGDRILDVACGGGELCWRIVQKDCEVHGLDISVESVQRAKWLIKNSLRCSIVVGDAEQLPYKDGCFDKVVCSCSLEHFQDDLKALKEMNRVLRPHGISVLTVDSSSYPMAQSLREKHRVQCKVVRYYDSEEISQRLEQSGFVLLSNKYMLNSPLTAYFYELFVATQDKYWRHLILQLLGDLLIPLFLISDRWLGKKNCGYTLLVKGKKK